MFSELDRERRAFSGICGWTAAANFNIGNYYSVLGAHPFLGRLINPSDMQGSQVSQVAVISYELWSRRFAADPAIVGKTIRIEGKLFSIIGVTSKAALRCGYSSPEGSTAATPSSAPSRNSNPSGPTFLKPRS